MKEALLKAMHVSIRVAEVHVARVFSGVFDQTHLPLQLLSSTLSPFDLAGIDYPERYRSIPKAMSISHGTEVNLPTLTERSDIL